MHQVHGFHIPQIKQCRAGAPSCRRREIPDRWERADVGTFRASDYGADALGSWPEFTKRANDETLIKVSIEDPEGFEALPGIVQVEGIDVISFGMNDLSDSMGLSGQRNHPKLIEAVDKAIATIVAAGKWPGLTTSSAADIPEAFRRGGRYLTTSVSKVLADGSGSYLKAMKELR